MSDMTRRLFGKTAAATAALAYAGTAVPKLAFGKPKPRLLPFPRGFIWGCATAAYQIEGATEVDGRGPSIWDTFSHTQGKTNHGDTGDIADDSYHLYKEDVASLKALGVHAYRMSISWSRIFPEGKGRVNPKGIDHYKRVIDELLAHHIRPFITLFHWDLPQALAGGWQSRDTALAFADYAAFVAKQLGDRVGHFMTTNEFTCFTDLSYGNGQFAPGLKLPPGQVNQIRHHAILAHGLGVQAIRANTPQGTAVGLAENAHVYVPVAETAEDIAATQRATRDRNAPFLTAVMEGKYIDSYLQQAGADAPKVQPGDMLAIGSPLDFVGLNIYTPDYVSADQSTKGYRVEAVPKSYPRMDQPWLLVGPECMYWGVRNVCDLWNPKGIYITENGCSCDDAVTDDGQVHDTDRIMYLRNHLTHLQRATSEGYAVKGYFHWSLLDNFEWADGYSKRFGLYHVDYQTRKRTPKLSAYWYRKLIEYNAVV